MKCQWEGKGIDSPPPFRTTDKVPIFERSSAASICFGFKEMDGVGSRRLLSLFFLSCLTSMGYHISQLLWSPLIGVFLSFRHAAPERAARKGETGRESKGETGMGKGKGKGFGTGTRLCNSGFLHFTTAYYCLPPIADFKKVIRGRLTVLT
jgi:hypothetical protein